uniref:Leucine-rich repeat receptor-like protein kinase n=1 Tax=Pohlia nutans TaxID=140635 RepID=A0A1P8DZ09_9BRYO|nr:leucine-rich repeat receptor-like protein kinase [Pohlia nutans]
MRPWWAALALVFTLQVNGVVALLVPREAQAMQQLQRGLQVHKTAWPASEDPCTRWQGVQCISNHVDSIKLSQLLRVPNRSLNVALDGFRALSSLRELNASGFALGRSIPDWFFTSLTALQVLDLASCGLFGSIPWTLGNLANLTFLSLASNNITGDIPATIGRLRSLATLNLSFNKLNGPIPDSFFNATGLVNVDLSHNNLTGQFPASVGNLINSQIFIASNNELTGVLPPQLGSLSSLTQLDLSHNLFSGPIPGEVGKLKNLVFLSLATNNFSGAFPGSITNCTKLSTLNLRENVMRGVIPEAIGELRNLVTLDISSNRVTGLLPAGLATLLVLTTVDIAHNYFYGPILDLTSVQSLNVSHNFFKGSVPVGLLPRAAVKKNCLNDMPGQHALRTCVKFYARKKVIFGAPSSPPVTTPVEQPQESAIPESDNKGSRTKHLVPILSGVLGGVGLVVLVASLVFCIHRCVVKKNRGSGRTNGSLGGSVRGGSNRATAPAVPTSRMGEVFTYAQLQQATKNFSLGNLISNGHSGDLYKGLLESGAMVAVKRIDLNKVKMETYLQELEVLGRASHTRLVLLLGHCLDGDDEKFLVYKYTPNGDLASALHMKGSPGPCEDVLQSLDWITRLKIAIGVAEALSYLHSECSPPIVHRDVKASSILLDDKFEVRLGSLSDARVQDGDPHPSRITRLLGLSQSSDQGDAGAAVSTSSDVYNFGKVLLELVSGKLGISGSTPDPRSEAWLEWALPLISVHDKESLPKLVDPSLIVDEDLLEEVWAMAIIARACLHAKPHKRPSMRHVLKALENPHKVVREENFGESLAMRTSSHSSWNEALFGSWRHNHNNNNNTLSMSGFRDDTYHGSSLPVAKATGIAASSSAPGHARRGSSDIVPEPIEEETMQ